MKPIIYSELKVGDPVVHQDGTAGVVVALVPNANEYCRLCIMWPGERWQNQVVTYSEDGRYSIGRPPTAFLAPKAKVKKELWLVLGKLGIHSVSESENAAVEYCKKWGCTKVQKVEWEVEA